jgi:ribosomal protein L37AE/L43A
MRKLTERDYSIIVSPQQRSYYTCTKCSKESHKIYRLNGDAEFRAKIGVRLSWLCPDCFREFIERKYKEQVQFT